MSFPTCPRTRVRLPPPPPTQYIRTALRALQLGGRCHKSQGVYRGPRDVVGPADISLGRLQPDLPQQPPQQECRPLRPSLQEVLHAGQPLFDPLRRGSLEDLISAPLEAIKFLTQRLNPAFGFFERLRQRPAASSLADEVEEVGEPPLFCAELDFSGV